jgi:hypothetical protein
MYMYIYAHTHTFCCAAVGENPAVEEKAFCRGGELGEKDCCLERGAEARLADTAFCLCGHI